MKNYFKKLFTRSQSRTYTIVDIAVGNGWQTLNDGKTIGQKGSENGCIILDQENQNGARITLEENANGIPFVITFGIYGLMFHTEFTSDIKSATEYIEKKKQEINVILRMYDINSNERDSAWNERHNMLLENLVSK